MHPANPFFVLEIAATSSIGEIERQGQKLLGLLAVGATRAKTYSCPLGTFARDETMVREAVAGLRDPAHRAKDACLAGLLVVAAPGDVLLLGLANEPDAPLAEAFPLAGFPGL